MFQVVSWINIGYIEDLLTLSTAEGLPFFGNYFEVFPEHLGNHQRMFDRYGPIFRENNMGATSYQINDPKLVEIVFAESDFFTKEINSSHPLYPIKDQQAGVFLADTSSPSWKIVHKFLPPALGPKAVRHYAPTMNATIDKALPIFDQLEESGEAWNAYQYMSKLGSEAIGKLVMGMEFHHWDSVDAPMHDMVQAIAQTLSLNKKISTHGDWVSIVNIYSRNNALTSDAVRQSAIWRPQEVEGSQSLPAKGD